MKKFNFYFKKDKNQEPISYVEAFNFYFKKDKNQEPISYVNADNRLKAAKYFAAIKKLDLKTFLSMFSINK